MDIKPNWKYIRFFRRFYGGSGGAEPPRIFATIFASSVRNVWGHCKALENENTYILFDYATVWRHTRK